MKLPPYVLECVMIVRFERLAALRFELANLRLDRGLVDAGGFMMLARIDAERLAERGQQMLFVQLRVALDGVLVLHAFRDVAQLLDCLRLELMKCVGHRSSETQNLSRLLGTKLER